MAMSEAQLMHAERKWLAGRGSLPRQIIRSDVKSDYKGRGGFDNSNVCPSLVLAYGQSYSDDPFKLWTRVKLFLRDVFSQLPGMVYKFMDPCRGEHLWYKGNSNF